MRRSKQIPGVGCRETHFDLLGGACAWKPRGGLGTVCFQPKDVLARQLVRCYLFHILKNSQVGSTRKEIELGWVRLEIPPSQHQALGSKQPCLLNAVVFRSRKFGILARGKTITTIVRDYGRWVFRCQLLVCSNAPMGRASCWSVL
jgi:hypothetical protein